VATQLAIAVTQARLHQQVKQQAEEMEIRVRERTAELEAANRELESFSYSVSHDLRAPLRAIDGYGRMLEEDHAARLDAEGLRLLAVIRKSSLRMGVLIDDLLDFSRLGRKTLNRAAVDMEALARDAWTELGASATVQLTMGVLPSANGDPALLGQVWINLLSNALKYSGRQPSPRIEVAGERSGADLVYRVSDNGAGFDMRYYDKLFRVFQRLHREDEFPGTGVGLAIVQRIVTRHGGRVWAEAEVGRGAKFSFTLPAPNAL
jgi:light-regulated signal transduction histidine kinase (bacteriophytochrome)